MRLSFYFPVCCCILFFASGCLKDQPDPSVAIDLKVPSPVISTLSNGTKKLDFTIEVTQTGDFFYQDFALTFSKPDSTAVLDSYQVILPSPHEFVHHTVVVSQPGTYRIDVFVGPVDGGVGSGNTVIVQ